MGGFYSRDVPVPLPRRAATTTLGDVEGSGFTAHDGARGARPPAECLAGMLPSGDVGYHPPMQNPSTPKGPRKGKVGANYPLSQNGTKVKVAKDNGENRAIPQTHCTAKRAASNVRHTY